MNKKTLDKADWQDALNAFTKRHLEQYPTVRVVGDEMGDQVISEGNLPFFGVEYDDESDVVRVVLGQEGGSDPDSVAHEVEAQEVVLVPGDEPGEEAVVIVDEADKLIIEFNSQEKKLLQED